MAATHRYRLMALMRFTLLLFVLGAGVPLFRVVQPAGLTFVHQNSPTAQKYLIETMGGGVALLDYNHDGLLDIFLVNSGALTNAMRAPELFHRAEPRYWNRLYRQNPDGTFADVTEAAGLANAGDGNHGMGVAAADYDNDGYTDLYITSYGHNILYHNNGDGTFTERALEAGVALSDDGKPISGMGVDFRDYDNDGRPDIVVTDLARQVYALFHNDGQGSFSYRSREAGLGTLTAGSSGWGIRFEDFDNDGWKDIFAAQSHVMDNAERIDPSLRYKEPPLLALNHNGRFERADAGLNTPVAGRGAAFGDLNHDGGMDVVMSVLGGRPFIFENHAPKAHWLTLALEGTPSNRDGLGARVHVEGQGDAGQWQYATSSGSYLLASDKRVHFGLGSRQSVDFEIWWPSGIHQKLSHVAADQFLVVREPAKP